MNYLAILLFLAACLLDAPSASARGLGKLVTKATQKAVGVEFELSAVGSPDAVIISISIPKSGKLESLRKVRLSVPAQNGKDFLILAPLEMAEREGAVHAWAQIAPELAAKASLDLVVEEGRREFYYAVRVAEYITDRPGK